jgi:hypothetical protein
LTPLKVAKSPEIDGLAGAQFSHDNAHRRIVRASGKIAIEGAVIEVNEPAQEVIELGPRPVRVTKWSRQFPTGHDDDLPVACQ